MRPLLPIPFLSTAPPPAGHHLCAKRLACRKPAYAAHKARPTRHERTGCTCKSAHGELDRIVEDETCRMSADGERCRVDSPQVNGVNVLPLAGCARHHLLHHRQHIVRRIGSALRC
eukprot:scaffold34347_cov118-Isochrysis_galbana.AAC.3